MSGGSSGGGIGAGVRLLLVQAEPVFGRHAQVRLTRRVVGCGCGRRSLGRDVRGDGRVVERRVVHNGAGGHGLFAPGHSHGGHQTATGSARVCPVEVATVQAIGRLVHCGGGIAVGLGDGRQFGRGPVHAGQPVGRRRTDGGCHDLRRAAHPSTPSLLADLADVVQHRSSFVFRQYRTHFLQHLPGRQTTRYDVIVRFIIIFIFLQYFPKEKKHLSRILFISKPSRNGI